IELLSQQQDGKRLTATFAISHWLEQPQLSDEKLQITVADKFVSAELTARAQSGTVATAPPSLSFWSILPLALLGGVSLNIMPCVLPLLGLKLQGLMGATRQRSDIRRQFVASALGIITSFMLLALMSMAVKSAGHA